ncbi:MAG TPA: transketolase family protein [Candidatus Nanoarchaeia archaeon]|nr:transketolase family protein [Candidatus Nanoarchaeia archaeon]
MEQKAEATRDGFAKGIVKAGENKDVVVLDADLAESTRSIKFKEKFPDRFFDMGIAEMDMVGTAAGLAASGKIPFACSFAVFSTGRAYEAMRLAAISKLNVKIVGSHAGLATGEDGATHQSIDDISLTRTLPGMTVIQPVDSLQAEKATIALAEHQGIAYLRTGRAKLPILTKESDKFQIGKGEILAEGKDLAIIATGSMVSIALEAAQELSRLKLSAKVINIHTIKPLDAALILKAAKETGRIITAEDHSIIGGLGSAVSEVLSENYPVKLKRIGLNDTFGESGKPESLYQKYGLTKENLIKAAKALRG